MKKYYKILNKKECHHGLKYKTGLNVDPIPFKPYGSCEPGGIYFSDEENILQYANYGPYIREVIIPEDAQVYHDPGGPKLKANKVILKKRQKWCTLEKLKTLLPKMKYVPYDVISEVAKCKLDVIKYVRIKISCDPAAINSLLSLSCGNGRLNVVKYLVSMGQADLDSALYYAIVDGHLSIVKYLLSQGAEISSYSLIDACMSGHLNIVKYIVSKGVDINARENSALYTASVNGHFNIVKYLISKGAIVTRQPYESASTQQIKNFLFKRIP